MAALERRFARGLVGALFVFGAVCGGARPAVAQGTTDSDPGVTIAKKKVPDDSPTPPALFPEPRIFTRGLAEVSKRMDKPGPKRNGPYLRIGNGITGSGWIAAGPGYRHRLLSDMVTFDASGAVSWREFKTLQAKMVGSWFNGRATAGVHAVWEDRTQVNYFGAGPDSVLVARTSYRLRASDYMVFGGIGTQKTWLVDMRVGTLVTPEVSTATGWNRTSYPDTVAVFDEQTAPALTSTPTFRHAEIVLTRSSLDSISHPTFGNLVQLAAAIYRDRDLHRYSFNRYEAKVMRLQPVVPNLWTLALHGTAIFETEPSGNDVPFYLWPSLGAHNALRGFPTNRFSDRNAAAANVESRWALMPHVEAALFLDLGEVAHTPGQFSSRTMRTSVGTGFRVHTGKATLVRVDIAHTSEGWQMVFRMNEPLTMAAFKRGFTVAPILP